MIIANKKIQINSILLTNISFAFFPICMIFGNLLTNNLKDGDNRIISGDILTGQQIEVDGSLGFYHTSITVIEEGKEQEFLGWMMPGIDKFSLSHHQKTLF